MLATQTPEGRGARRCLFGPEALNEADELVSRIALVAGEEGQLAGELSLAGVDLAAQGDQLFTARACARGC